MIRRDIQPQWVNIADWYWKQYEKGATPNTDLSIWDILKRDHDIQRIRPMSMPGWSQVWFPDEQSYAFFLLKWS